MSMANAVHELRERPILFAGEMVCAILEGRKTQTRRVVTPQPSKIAGAWWELRGAVHAMFYGMGEPCDAPRIRCPYGAPGDRLWIRETWQCFKAGTDELLATPPRPNVGALGYAATEDARVAGHPERVLFTGPWRPSIFMPRWASRLTLEIAEVRVQRLQEISDDDILAEGLDQQAAEVLVAARAARFKTVPEHWVGGADEATSYCRPCCEREVARLQATDPKSEGTVDGGYCSPSDGQAFCESCGVALDVAYTDYAVEEELRHFATNAFDVTSPDDCHSLKEMLTTTLWTGGAHSAGVRRLVFRAGWDALNKKRGYGWGKNPWVWAITFRRVV